MKLADQLREMKIYNCHGLIQRFGDETNCAYIYYVPHSRQTMSSFGTHVSFPKSGKYVRNAGGWSMGRKDGFEKAKEYIAQKCGVQEWKQSPFSTSELVPKAVIDRAKAACKEMITA